MARKSRDRKTTAGNAAQRKTTARKDAAKGGRKRPLRPLLNYRQMQALSNEERVRIFAVFCEREASPKEVSKELDEGLSQVSYHVSVLSKCGLITLVRTAPRRGAVEHFYEATVPTLIPPDAWTNLPPAIRKTVSLEILQEFFNDARDSIGAGIFDASPGELSLTPLVLDEPGVEEFGRLAREFLGSVQELQSAASRRMGAMNDDGSEAISATVFLASFLSARSPEENRKASARKAR